MTLHYSTANQTELFKFSLVLGRSSIWSLIISLWMTLRPNSGPTLKACCQFKNLRKLGLWPKFELNLVFLVTQCSLHLSQSAHHTTQLSQSHDTVVNSSANQFITCTHEMWKWRKYYCHNKLATSQIPCPLQTGSYHFQRSHQTTAKLPGSTAECPRNSSRSLVRQLPTATHT